MKINKCLILISLFIVLFISLGSINAADNDISCDLSSNNLISQVSIYDTSSNNHVNNLLLDDNSSSNSSKNNNSKNPLSNESSKKSTELFVSDEVIVEGEDGILTAILTDKKSKPLVGKKVTVFISNLKLSGITKIDGIANIAFGSLKAGKYSARAYFEGGEEYYSSYCDFIIRVLPNTNKESNNEFNNYSSSVSEGISMEPTGNPLFILLIALSVIGIGSFRRKF